MRDGNPKFYTDPYFSPLSLKGITKNSLPPGACEIFILFCAGEAQLSVMKNAGEAKNYRLMGPLLVSGCAGSQRREGKGGKGRRREDHRSPTQSPQPTGQPSYSEGILGKPDKNQKKSAKSLGAR